MLRISRDLAIDENDIEISFVRASGPGGQNVNKLSTSAQLRFDASRLPLPEDAAARLARLAGQRMTKEGVIVIHAQRFRTQERNRADAIERLLNCCAKRWCGRRRGVQPSRPSAPSSAGWKARRSAATSRPAAAAAGIRRLVCIADAASAAQQAAHALFSLKQPATTTAPSLRPRLPENNVVRVDVGICVRRKQLDFDLGWLGLRCCGAMMIAGATMAQMPLPAPKPMDGADAVQAAMRHLPYHRAVRAGPARPAAARRSSAAAPAASKAFTIRQASPKPILSGTTPGSTPG